MGCSEICRFGRFSLSLPPKKCVCYETHSMGDDVRRRELAMRKLLILEKRDPKTFEALAQLLITAAARGKRRR